MKTEKLFAEQKDNIWGGRKLIEKYGKPGKGGICAESWELSFHPDGRSKLNNGEYLSDTVTEAELGENAKIFDNFPMMIKLIDAKDDLSVQVHPSDAYALKNESSYGKTEMWYIVEADEGAGIYLGFKHKVTEEEVEAAIKTDSLSSLMNFFEVKAGDCFFIPSGTIHAIGTGCLIYEIQQNSNLTYRVYDYGRRDKNGNTRELHVEKALKVLDLSEYEKRESEGELLGISKYFTAKRLCLSGETVTLGRDEKSFRCVTAVLGEGYINGERMSLGDSFFIPAYEELCLSGEMTVIIAELRRYGIRTAFADNGYTAELYDDLGNTVSAKRNETEDGAVAELLKIMNITENDLSL